MTTTTVSIPSPGGTVVIADTTAVAVEALTAVVVLQTAMLEKLFGSAGSQIKGGITASAAGSVGELAFIFSELQQLTSQMRSLNGVMGNMIKELDTGNRGLANVQTTMTKQLLTQQLAVSDQLYNNQFQQTATQSALADAKKPPVEVPTQEFTDKIKTRIASITDIQGQILVGGFIESTLTSTISTANTELLKWAAETELYKGLVKWYGEVKTEFKAVFAAAEARAAANAAAANTLSTTQSLNTIVPAPDTDIG